MSASAQNHRLLTTSYCSKAVGRTVPDAKTACSGVSGGTKPPKIEKITQHESMVGWVGVFMLSQTVGVYVGLDANFGSRSHLTLFLSFWVGLLMSALRPVVWSDWVALAKQHLRDHPRVDHRGVSVAARRGSAGARATYALLTASQHAAGRALGAAPCQLCSEWTHSWCESCDPPAWAICTECDAARLVCPECEAKGETWESGHSRQCNEEHHRGHRLHPGGRDICPAPDAAQGPHCRGPDRAGVQ